MATLNHNPDKLLGRVSAGTLQLTPTSHGIDMRADLPGTPTGQEVLELVSRGDLKAGSFAFTVARDSWSQREGQKPHRTLEEIGQLLDVSVVAFPAYAQTSVSTAGPSPRSVDGFLAAIERDLRLLEVSMDVGRPRTLTAIRSLLPAVRRPIPRPSFAPALGAIQHHARAVTWSAR